jgi:hypothetical protein
LSEVRGADRVMTRVADRIEDSPESVQALTFAPVGRELLAIGFGCLRLNFGHASSVFATFLG